MLRRTTKASVSSFLQHTLLLRALFVSANAIVYSLCALSIALGESRTLAHVAKATALTAVVMAECLWLVSTTGKRYDKSLLLWELNCM